MAPLSTLEENINKTEECRKDIINSINNKLNIFNKVIPNISIDTPLTEIDKKLNNFNITNMLINNTTYYVKRNETNLKSNIDPRINLITTDITGVQSYIKFEYIANYSIKASGIISFEADNSTKPYIKITDSAGNIKTNITVTTDYTTKIINNIDLNTGDIVELLTTGGNAWNAITAITLESLIPVTEHILFTGNRTDSDITKTITLYPGKYKVYMTGGGGSGALGYQTEAQYRKLYIGGNGSELYCNMEILGQDPVNCVVTIGKKGGNNKNTDINTELPYIGQNNMGFPVHIAGYKTPGGYSSISINNQRIIKCPGGGAVSVKNGSITGVPSTSETNPTYTENIESLVKLTNVITINSTESKGPAYDIITASRPDIFSIFNENWGWAGCIERGSGKYKSGPNSINPLGGAVLIEKIL